MIFDDNTAHLHSKSLVVAVEWISIINIAMLLFEGMRLFFIDGIKKLLL